MSRLVMLVIWIETEDCRDLLTASPVSRKFRGVTSHSRSEPYACIILQFILLVQIEFIKPKTSKSPRVNNKRQMTDGYSHAHIVFPLESSFCCSQIFKNFCFEDSIRVWMKACLYVYPFFVFLYENIYISEVIVTCNLKGLAKKHCKIGNPKIIKVSIINFD